MYICLQCNKILKEYMNCSCGNKIYIPNCFISIDSNMIENNDMVVEEVNINSSKLKNINDMMENKIKKEYIHSFNFLGELPLHFKMLIFGKAGSGKSSFSMTLANIISKSKWRGKTLYISIEEGTNSATMQEKIRSLSIDSENLFFDDKIDLELIKEEGIKNIILDSITVLRGSVEEISEIYECIDGALIVIAHVTKQEIVKGNSSIEHDMDIISRVSKLKVTLEKNRFGPLYKNYNISYPDDENYIVTSM